MFISATFSIVSFCILLFIPQKKIRIEFSANYPLTTFRIPQSAFRKIPLPSLWAAPVEAFSLSANYSIHFKTHITF